MQSRTTSWHRRRQTLVWLILAVAVVWSLASSAFMAIGDDSESGSGRNPVHSGATVTAIRTASQY